MLAAIDKTYKFLGLKIQGDLGPFTCYTSKRNRIVWFLKAPPKTPLTEEQLNQLAMFREAAWAWRSFTDEQRQVWTLAARKASLRISGYNLLTYLVATGDDAAVRTIERQTGISLPRP
jgi:hypothetical protein